MTKNPKTHLPAQAATVGPLPPNGFRDTAETSVATPNAAQPPIGAIKTMSIPECGRIYFGLSRNGSYAAAKRGDIPVIQIGRLKRAVPSVLDARLAAAGQSPAIEAE